jgi:hypothetical protein
VTRLVLAHFDDSGLDVYQAFEPAIADEAVRLQRFGARFELDRMTWIKPSFGWMLYRSGHATKHRQERVLRVTLRHDAFLEMLGAAVPSAWDRDLYGTEAAWSAALHASEARYQWDPDRDLASRPLDRRALQLGIAGSLIRLYAHEWIVRIADVTPLAHAIRAAVISGGTLPSVPTERPYALPPAIAQRLGIR